MALNPDRVDSAFHRALREHYSDEEIVELGAFIGFNIGYHTFFGTLRFYPMFAPDGRLVTQEESARIYGDAPVSLQSAADNAKGAARSAPPGTRIPRSSADIGHPGAHLRHPGTHLCHPGTHLRHAGESRDPEHLKATQHTAHAHMAPVALENVRDPELKSLIERCIALGVPDARFAGILAQSPIHAKAVLRALIHSHFEGHVEHRLKEVIRIQLARLAGDRYFAGLRSTRAKDSGLDEATIEAARAGFETDTRFDAASRWALRFAHELYRHPERIDGAFYAEGKRHWSEAQIMELGAFTALHYGMQAYARTLAIAAP